VTTAIGVTLPDGSASGAAETLASLPLSFRRSDGVTDSVVVVQGLPGWVEVAAAAARGGAAGIIVVGPTPADLAGLVALDQLAVAFVTDWQWSSNPAIPAAAAAFRTAALGAAALNTSGTGPNRLETRLVLPVGSDLNVALLEQLALVRRLVGPVDELHILDQTSRNCYAAGTTGGLEVDLSLVCTAATTSVSLTRLLTVDGSVELEVGSPTTARPARVTVTGPDGMTQLPTLYESAHRASWRRLRDQLSGIGAGSDLSDLRADTATLNRSSGRTTS